MKVNKGIKTEVLQVYDRWLHSYLHGDVKTYDFYFDNEFHFIGSTNNEEFLNRKDTTKFFSDTAEQLAGKCDLRNDERQIEQFGELVFITHFFDAWFSNGRDYSYYGRFRFTSVLRRNTGGWRFIYQHFSTPDSKTNAGETIGFDKINEENIELREAIQRRTFELQEKNRELEIESALEKVRSRTMAMQRSDELAETSFLLDQQVRALGIQTWGCAFNIYGDGESTEWFGNEAGGINTYTIPRKGIFKEYYQRGQDGESLFIKEFSGEECTAHYAYMTSIPVLGSVLERLKKENGGFPTYQIDHVAYFKYGYILFITRNPVPEAHELFQRFADLFEQTYTRFLDLQKAEAQAREAKIEASLEKVRNVTLTLKKSDDMLDIAKVLYEQLLELGFTNIRNAIIDIHNDEDETFIDYDYSHSMSSAVTQFSFYGDPVIEQQIEKVQSSNDAFFEIELKGDQLKELIKTRIENGEKDDPRLHKTDHLTYNLYSFGNGAIGISNFGILSEDQKKILKRFRNVFTFAYKRYTDLANAEAQTREAKIEASLEKVRSVALGLNKSEEMLQVAQVLYEQLVALGFDNIRNCIIDIDNDDGDTFLDYDYSDEMGGTITQMSYKDDPTLKEQLEDIIATTDGYSEMVLEGQQLQDLIDMRRNNGEADDPRLMNTKSLSYILYAFGKGAIGISNFGKLPEHQKAILNRFRNVFTFAYQRYTDLAQAEEQATALLAEKQRLEMTLLDLQATQKQLIHAEKMASLGELTAGIAHEIQNPLNFVNNFSEVSQELLDELKEDIRRGNMEGVQEILQDVVLNLEKINQHGRRADAIVKGMLQHSRKTVAEREPTNINALCDEFLRLAYHGIRARDKSFNATLETDFDKSIGKVNVIAQDIGRVVLNLINNAFYAVNEKRSGYQSSNGDKADYKPTVSLRTKKKTDAIEIRVSDNGNGIPQNILDKIFQPFFTTKPSGQGTGLGLSLSYDIVKAHGGELEVETKAGEGTVFIILLPLN